MNKINITLKTRALIMALLIFAMIPAFALADIDQNLIVNNSFETATELGDMPIGWSVGGWGTNVRYFNYLSTGAFDGSKSVSITLSEQLDELNVPIALEGDAKWLHSEVDVTAGSNYIYTDYYKSDVSSRVVVRYNKGTCVTNDVGCTYDQLAVLPPASDWTKFQTQFTVPEDVISINVFHLIENVGNLELDAVSLEKVIELVITDMVPNNSVEQSMTGLTPLAWYFGNWGENTPVFEYVTNEGQEGARSVKVTLENHTSGDAKWYFEPQAVEAGEDYKFTAWYKSNVVPHVVVQFIKSDDSVFYLGLQRPQPQGEEWQKYESEFSVPSGVKKATIFFFIDTVGYVQTDNYHITPYTYEGFDRALVSLTFDDGAEANYETVLPFVNNLGIKTTHCYATEYVEGNDVQIIRLLGFYNSGHEICSHSVSHPDLTTLSPSDLTFELTHSKEYLESIIGAAVPNIATPFGAYNETVNNRIKDIYSSHRTVDEGYNSKDNLDKYRLKAQNMKPTTTLAEFKEWVNKAIADKTWLILVYHDVNTEEIGVTPYGTYTPDFEEQMTWLASTGVTVKTYQDALNEVTGVTPVCPVGTTLNVHSCEPIVCEVGTNLVGNECVQIVCDIGFSLVGNSCEPIICDLGSTLVGNSCEVDPIICPVGTTLVDNICVPNPKKSSGGGGRSKPKTLNLPLVVVATTTVSDLGTVAGVSTSTLNGNNGGKYLFTRNLKVGMRGDDVAELQKRLTEEGLYSGPITNYFGTMTESAVKSYQRKYGIPATGLVGQMTIAKLNSTAVTESSTNSIPEPKATQEQILANLQKQLKELQAKLAELLGQ